MLFEVLLRLGNTALCRHGVPRAKAGATAAHGLCRAGRYADWNGGKWAGTGRSRLAAGSWSLSPRRFPAKDGGVTAYGEDFPGGQRLLLSVWLA